MKHFPHWAPQALRFRWHRWRGHARLLGGLGPRFYFHWNWLKLLTWTRALWNLRHYRLLSAEEVRAARRSEKVFIFGSGYSLNEIGAGGWAHFAAHDVFGFSGFVHQRWVRVDFHLIRNWDDWQGGGRRWRATAEIYAEALKRSGCFDEAVFILQGDYYATFANTLLGWKLLPTGARVFRYRTAPRLDGLPTQEMSAGVSHVAGTLGDAVNIAYQLGWKEIVLVGVDLYDSRYFWGPPDQTIVFDDRGQLVPSETVAGHGQRWNEPHATARNGIVEAMRRWAAIFAASGVRLTVFNPRSLLTGALPVYERPHD